MLFAIATAVVLVVLILCVPALFMEKVDDPPTNERRARPRTKYTIDPHKVEFL